MLTTTFTYSFAHRRSIFHTAELCQILLKHTIMLEEQAAEFLFYTTKVWHFEYKTDSNVL
jgi:hypothetical protein